MINFNDYLIQKGLKETTIIDIKYRLDKYYIWCKKEGENPGQIGYKAIIRYIKHLKNKHQQSITINNQLHRIKTYFDYLLQEDIRGDNPLEELKIKGAKKRILSNILSNDELEDIYYSFESDNIKDMYHKACAKRNRIITGLLIYQGLNNTDLSNLKTEHLQLYKGTIYIPSAGDNKSRTLVLKAWQVIELLEYINEIRPMMQIRTATNDDKLFPLKAPFNTILNAIVKKIKRCNSKVINARHIRASVISNWLKQYNIREVQQMCGHKYIGSTEKYKQDDIESLHEAINNFHPMQ